MSWFPKSCPGELWLSALWTQSWKPHLLFWWWGLWWHAANAEQFEAVDKVTGTRACPGGTKSWVLVMRWCSLGLCFFSGPFYFIFRVENISQTDGAVSPQEHVPVIHLLECASRWGEGRWQGREGDLLNTLSSTFLNFYFLILEYLVREEAKGRSLPFGAK